MVCTWKFGNISKFKSNVLKFIVDSKIGCANYYGNLLCIVIKSLEAVDDLGQMLSLF